MRVKNYEAGNAPQIVRLFYETVRSVSRTYYSKEQLAAWAKNVPDPMECHERSSGRCTLVAEEGGRWSASWS